MKTNFLTVIVICAGVAAALCGCRAQTDAKTELEKAASALAEPPPAQAAQPAAEAATQPAPAPGQQMNQAMEAYKAGQFEDAVTRLQKLRATPAMSPEQRIALNDAMAAVMTEIYSLAAKGDARAIQAIAQYERMQTMRR